MGRLPGKFLDTILRISTAAGEESSAGTSGATHGTISTLAVAGTSGAANGDISSIAVGLNGDQHPAPIHGCGSAAHQGHDAVAHQGHGVSIVWRCNIASCASNGVSLWRIIGYRSSSTSWLVPSRTAYVAAAIARYAIAILAGVLAAATNATAIAATIAPNATALAANAAAIAANVASIAVFDAATPDAAPVSAGSTATAGPAAYSFPVDAATGVQDEGGSVLSALLG